MAAERRALPRGVHIAAFYRCLAKLQLRSIVCATHIQHQPIWRSSNETPAIRLPSMWSALKMIHVAEQQRCHQPLMCEQPSRNATKRILMSGRKPTRQVDTCGQTATMPPTGQEL